MFDKEIKQQSLKKPYLWGKVEVQCVSFRPPKLRRWLTVS